MSVASDETVLFNAARCNLFPQANHFLLAENCPASIFPHTLQPAAAGDPVVFIHGLGDESDTWRHVVSLLNSSHRLILFDLPGFGRSEKPDQADYSGILSFLGAVPPCLFLSATFPSISLSVLCHTLLSLRCCPPRPVIPSPSTLPILHRWNHLHTPIEASDASKPGHVNTLFPDPSWLILLGSHYPSTIQPYTQHLKP